MRNWLRSLSGNICFGTRPNNESDSTTRTMHAAGTITEKRSAVRKAIA